MSSKSKRKVVRQSEFKIVARGIHRVKPDYSRLMRATIDHYTSTLEADSSQPRPSDDPKERGGHDGQS